MNKKRKVTKRIAAWFLCLAMVVTTINLPVFTKEVKAEEAPKCGENAYYAYDETTKTLRIYGSGSLYDNAFEVNYDSSGNNDKHRASIAREMKKVIIGKDITALSDSAFYSCSQLETVEFEEGSKVEIIGVGAFYSCYSLSSFNMPDSVVSVGVNAFNYCSNMSDITLSNNLETIDTYAFVSCNKLKDIVIPRSVTRIGGSAFEYCKNLQSITISNPSVEIESYAFAEVVRLNNIHVSCSFNAVIEGDTDASIYWKDKGVDDFDIVIKDIHDFTSYECLNSEKHTEKCSDCGEAGEQGNHNFFDETGKPVEECTLCKTTNTQMCGESAYYVYDEENKKLYIYGSGSIADYAFCPYEGDPDDKMNTDANRRSIATSVEKVVVGSGITEIGYDCFYESSLKEILFDEGSKLTDIGEYVFGYSSLEKIVVPDSVKTIKYSAFAYCAELSSVTLSKNLTTIEDAAFGSCAKLTVIELPEGVKVLGEECFCNTAISEITIPSSVQSIGTLAVGYKLERWENVKVTPFTIKGYTKKDDCVAYKYYLDNKPETGWTYEDTHTHDYTNQPYVDAKDGLNHHQLCAICEEPGVKGNHDFSTEDGANTAEKCSLCEAKNIAYSGLDIKATTVAYDGTEKTAEITGIDAANYTVTGDKATNAGKHTITLTGKGEYVGTREVEWTISPKELTPSITGAAAKVYDGTTTVQEENTLSISLAGICGEDEVSASATSYAYADKNAAEEKNVVASGITLSGAAKDNYTVATTVTTKVGKITKATPTYTKPTDLTGVCGKALSTVELTGGFEWTDDTNAKLVADSDKSSSTVTKKAKYVPADTTNYVEVEDISIDITVSHDLKAESNSDGTHSGKCQNCSYKATAEDCSGGTATCVKKAECEICGAEYGSYGAHTGKTEIKNAKEATCEEPGYSGDTYCKDCEIKLESGTEVQAKGHDMTRTVSAEVPATCHSEGATAVIGCSRCSHTEGGETIAKTAHTIKAVAEVPATCKAIGTKAHYVCETDGCDKKFADAEGNTEITDATTLVIEKDLTKHTGETEIKNAKEATCKAPGYTGDTYCKDCGTKLESGSETNKLTTHKYDEGTVTKEATCTEDGVLTKKCSVCDAETTEVIKAKGHTEVVDKAVAPTCTKDGLTEGKHCSECNAVLIKQETVKATGHNWDNGKITKEPTVTAEGVKTFTCTNSGCNDTKTESIAKLPAPKKNEVIEDKTGNDYKVTDPNKKEVTYKAPANKKAKTVTIPANVTIDGVTYKVTKIEDKAFKGNTTVTKITIPSSVTVIGAESFSGCKNLTTVSVPKNVTTIGKNAFKGCAKLTKVTLPSKCTKIGAGAFDGCKKMKTITIKSTKLTSKSVSAKAFKGLSKNVTIKVPKKQLKAYKSLLKKKGFKGKVK